MAIPAWLQDVTRAAQLLTRLSLESAAQASLIIKDGSLYAYSGELDQPAVEELARVVNHDWVNGGGTDLARFVRLEAGSDELMVYATHLINGMALVLAYDVKTPFSKIRSQAGKLARLLSLPPVEEPAIPVVQRVVLPDKDRDEEAEIEIPLPPLFDNIPPPTTSPVEGPLERLEWVPLSDYDHPPASSTPQPQIPVMPRSQPVPAVATAKVMPDMEPGSSTMSSLYLACTLITRMPQQPISNDMQSLLREGVTNLCIAYGWRLETISIRVEYMSWVVFVPPSCSPAVMIEIMRKRTSLLLFTEYPKYQAGNPSGDFWAPGYMVSSSSQLPGDEIVNSFFVHTRRRQGIPAGSLEQ